MTKGMQAAFRLDQRRLSGSKDHTGGTQGEGDNAGLHCAYTNRLGGLVAATSNDRSALRRPVSAAANALTQPVTSGPSKVGGSQFGRDFKGG